MVHIVMCIFEKILVIEVRVSSFNNTGWVAEENYVSQLWV